VRIPPALSRLAARLPRSPARRAALAWGAAALAAAALASGSVGLSRAEAAGVEAGAAQVRFWGEALRAPGAARALAGARFPDGGPGPPLAWTAAGAARAALAERLGWTGGIAGARVPTFVVAALLAALLAAWGFELAGTGGALLAPALLLAVPGSLRAAAVAGPDLASAALWLATAWAFHRGQRARGDGRRHLAWSVAAGLLSGAALATRLDAWLLPATLLAAWLASVAGTLRRDPMHALAGVPLAFPAAAVLAPAILLAAWPWLWHAPASRLAAALALRPEGGPWLWGGRILPSAPAAAPLALLALGAPGGALAAMAGGWLQALGRLAAAARGRDEEVRPGDELLLLACASVPLALGAWPGLPGGAGGADPSPAIPFLALLGARALVTAGRRLAPRRPAAVTGALAALALLPAAVQVLRTGPALPAWNELAGGAPGAASRGLLLPPGGEALAAALPALAAHAVPGARVWVPATSPEALRRYREDGRLRADLVAADGPEDADLSVWQPVAGGAGGEYRTWTAFGTARPVAGVYADEVPLLQVYARPGAWR